MESTPRLAAAIGELREQGCDRLTLDLREVCFIDSTGLRLILALDAACGRHPAGFRLIAGPPAVMRIFEITRTLERLPFSSSGPSPVTGPRSRRRTPC